jgi:hypothetical protein
MGSSRPRNSNRAGKAHRRILTPRRKPIPAKPSNSTTAPDAWVTALRQIHARLERIRSTAVVVAHALRQQNVQVDDDAACVLRWHVSDPLYEQVLRLKRIIAGGAP